jgi:PASTA domain
MSRCRIAVVVGAVSLGAVVVWLARDTTPLPLPRGGGIPRGSVVVPDLAGLGGAAVRHALNGLGLRLEGVRLVGGSEPLYTVVSQRPPAGTVVSEGSDVVVTLSTQGPGYTIGCPVLTDLVPAGEGDEPRVLRFVRRYLREERRPSPDRAFLWRSLDPYWRAVLAENGGPRPGTGRVPREFRSFGVSEVTPLTRPRRLNGGLRWQLVRAGLARACDRDERRVLATAAWWVPVDYPNCPCASGGQADWLVVRRATGFTILSQT